MAIVIGKTEIDVPHTELRFRKRADPVYLKMRERGESNIVSILAANRITDISQKAYNDLVKPTLKDMAYWKMKDIDIAARRISEAYEKNEIIGLVTDFDVDGISSAVVMKLALVEYMGFKEENVQVHVNNRMKFGYGFNDKALDAVMERSGDRTPTLLITADQGSNDSKTIAKYKAMIDAKGLPDADVIVTDHHHIKEGETCKEAYAFVNPQRPDDEFDDPTICGCVVALLVMSATRDYMEKEGLLINPPRLAPLLTYASLATVADCVSIKSGYNRAIIRKGLRDINQELIPAWKILKRKKGRALDPITAEDLGFTLGPAINADSRTGGDGDDAIKFLTAKTDKDAEKYYERLTSRNTRRKEIDLSMQEAAMQEASHQYYNLNRRSLVVYLPKGSHGIHGIVASRVKERFSCPVIIFSPVNVDEKEHPEKMITGSGRCIDDLSIIHMVQDRVEKVVDIPTSGGHPAAMGMKIKLGDLSIFQEKFDEVVKEEADDFGLTDRDFSPSVQIDHLFQDNELALLNGTGILNEIIRLEPYGQKFEAPVFAINGRLSEVRKFGKGANANAHMNLFFRDSSNVMRKAVVFHYARQPWIDDLAIGGDYTFAVTLNYDSFDRCLGMMIQSVQPGINAVSKAR